MKVLIAVMSCCRDQPTHKAIRDTWARNSPVDVRFFLGRGCKPECGDEIAVDALDDYDHVTEKSREIFRWALARDYDFVLHCGRDTYVVIECLMNAGLENYDYAGCKTGGSDQRMICPIEFNSKGWCEYASGGAGSWLSRKAMQLIVDSPMYHPADDLLYGMVLGHAGIPLFHHPGFLKHAVPRFPDYTIAVHLSRGTGVYDSYWMYKAHSKRGLV
jgi:hypothetical protein